MSNPNRSLRSTLAILTLAGTVLAVIVLAVFVVITTALRHTTEQSSASVESVRIVEEAEVDLLLHERATDPIVRRDVASSLRRRLAQAREFIATDEEARLLAEVEASVDAYLTMPAASEQRAARQEEAYGALEALVHINVSQARAAQARAERWDELANALGLGAGVLLIAFAVFAIFGLKRALQPVFSLSAVMERFSQGDWKVRAGERGHRELRLMARQFNDLADALVSQREARIAFLGGVAHDLKNPLSGLRLTASLLRAKRLPTSEQHIQGVAERISRAVLRMDRMVDDLLDVAKIAAGALTLNVQECDARELVKRPVDSYLAAGLERRLTLTVPDRELAVLCDGLRVEQVVSNLIDNAIKYSPPESPIEVAVGEEAGQLVIVVTDHGVGISERDRRAIFDAYRRVENTKDIAPGSGLGLYVVGWIVEAHGGRVEVDSTLGRGSTFRIFLPLEGARAQHRPPRAAEVQVTH